MQTINELLNRIRWDREFGKAAFELGYWDRVEKRVVRIGYGAVTPDREGGLLRLVNEEGVACSVPFHRVRCVWRDGP